MPSTSGDGRAAAAAAQVTADSDAVEPNWVAPARFADDDRVDTRRYLPSRFDPIVRAASTMVGGPIGRHAAVGRSRRWTPLRVLFLLALCMLALSWFGKSACIQTSPVKSDDPTVARSGQTKLDWVDQRQFTNLCYSDIIALYRAERLDHGVLPYQTYWYEVGADGQKVKRYMEYPVVTGMFMYGAAQVTLWWESAADRWDFVPDALDVVLFFIVVSLGMTLFWLVTIWATALTAGTRRWTAWMAALSPLVLVHAFTGFDAIPIMFVALAMLAWSREKTWLTGVFIGLGVASAIYPVLLLAVLAVLCTRTRHFRQFCEVVLAAVLVWGVVNVPIMMNYPNGWREFFRYNNSRGAEPDSLYRVIADNAGFTWNVDLLNLISALLTLAVVIGVAFLGLRAPTRPRVAQLMFLLVAGFLVVSKTWSPQHSLWLVPLAVLALPRAKLLFAWMAVDALVWIPRMRLFLDDDRKWLPEEWYTFAVVLRLIMLSAVCAVIIWQIWHPEADEVRRGVGDRAGEFVDDPADGLLNARASLDDAARGSARPPTGRHALPDPEQSGPLQVG